MTPLRKRFEISPRLARVIVWLLILTYIALFSWLSVTRHQAHRSDAYDMGNVNQALWNTVHGRFLYFTNWRGVELSLGTDSRLAMHVEPIYVLIAPLYAIWQRPETVLILQTVVLALGAWPVFWLARDRLSSNFSGIVFAAVYLLFPGLQAANLWEFHAVALAAPLLLYMFYFGQAGRWVWMWLFAILAMSTKEEIPLTVFLTGLYLVYVGLRPGDAPVSNIEPSPNQTSLRKYLQSPYVVNGLALATVAAIWFVLAVFVVVPSFEGDRSPYLSYFRHLTEGAVAGTGNGGPDLMAMISKLVNERNINYVIDLYTPVAFFSFLNPVTLIFSLPDMMINLLSDHEPMHFVQKYHYTAPMLPGVMISAVLGSAWLARFLSKRLGLPYQSIAFVLSLLVLGATGYYHYFHGYTPLARAFEPYRVTAHEQRGTEIAQTIPTEAAVSAQRFLNPQVSGRKTLYRYPYIGDAEYIFLDLASLHNEGAGIYGTTKKLINGDEFGLIRAEDGYLVFKRGATPDLALTDEFFSFMRVPNDDIAENNSQPQHPTNVIFGDVLKLTGFDVFYGRRTDMPQTPLRFNLYLQALEPIDENYWIALFLLDEYGQVIGGPGLTKEPGLEYWYPTSQWRVGDTIKLPMSNMPWWTAQYDKYNVALGILKDRKEPWDLALRLKPVLGDSPNRLRYAADETLVGLMDFRTDPGGMPVPIQPARQFDLPRGVKEQIATWEKGMQLSGYQLSSQRARPDENVEVTLYWQTAQPLDSDYTVFVHMINSHGQLVAQHDAQPDLGGFPTSTWQEGEVIPDRHSLSIPADATAGTYTLLVGFYDQSTGERERLTDSADFVELQTKINILSP